MTRRAVAALALLLAAASCAAPRIRPYRFLARADGVPVHWPCRTVRVATVPGSSGAEREIASAVVAARQASGVDLVYLGTAVGADASVPTPVFGWDTPEGHVDVLVDLDARPSTRDPDAEGEAQVQRPAGLITAATIRIFHRASPATLRSVLLHELGHATGLGHSDDADAVMARRVPLRPPQHYTDADLAGFRALSAAAACPE
ncbi:MAG TPA: matrixin family metalloprotease [Mycobacteriales bacterium]|nr:matrixin family metalloprotease [Mycobacteriales bacterium]